MTSTQTPVLPFGRWSVVAAAILTLSYVASAAAAEPSQRSAKNDFATSLNDLMELDVAEQATPATPAQGPYAEIEIIRERYPNRRVKIEREVTLDGEGNYVNHGTWKMWNSAGKLVAEGQYNMGKRVGVWTRWFNRDEAKVLRIYPFNRFQAPFVSQATFKDDKLDGDWVVFDAKQEKCSLISFQDGMREGPAILWMPGGQVLRETSYSQNIPVGDVLERDKTGNVVTTTTYIDGRRTISKISNFPGTKEKRTEAYFLSPPTTCASEDDFWNMQFAKYEAKGDELRHGPWKTWYANGQVQLEGYYRFDHEIGTFTWWHPNGQKAVQGDYVDGQQDGRWIWWHVNGQIASRGDYRSGKKFGQWRRWTDDGKLEQQAKFDPKNPADAEAQEPMEFSEKVPVLPWLSR